LRGAGRLPAPSPGVLFPLALPASRTRVAGVRAAAGLAELLVLVVVAGLAVPLFSPAIGESYGVGDALVHAVCEFVASAVFFSLAFLLSSIFNDAWRPVLLACAVAVALSMFELVFREVAPYGLYGVMSGETYFRTGGLPWLGLLVSTAVSAALLYAAARNVEGQDF